jgi:pilus assembly protein Flp/PilA
MMAQFVVALYGLYVGEQEGQGLVEYAIIVALTAVIIIVALIFLRDRINTLFSRVGNSINQ